MAQAVDAQPAPPTLDPNASYRWRLFATLFAINILNYADRFTLPAIAPLIAKDLHLSATEIGELGSAFLLVYAITALPVGELGDRFVRPRVVGLGVGIWSIATAATALCRSFTPLFLTRALVGVGEGSYFPPSTSMLSDVFPQERRSRVLAWWGMATPIGVFIGYAVGGQVGQYWGWPAACLLVGLPGLILAFLVARMRDPRRGASERLPATAGLRTSGLFGYKLLAIPTIVFVILMQACTFFVLGGLSFWTPTYLGQRFDLSVGTAGLLAGALFVVGGGAGTLGGGYLADQLAKRNLGARMLVPAWCSLLGAVFIAVALVMPSLALFLLGYMVAGGLLSAYSGPLTALLQDVAPPAGRARAVALSLLLAHLLGDAFSPTLLGSIADMFGGVAAGGLDKAFFLAPIAAVAAGILGMSGARFAGRDRAAMLASIEREAA